MSKKSLTWKSGTVLSKLNEFVKDLRDISNRYFFISLNGSQ